MNNTDVSGHTVKNRLIRSLDLVRIRLTKQLFVFARRIVIVERNRGRSLELVCQLHGRVSSRVINGSSGQEYRRFSDAVGGCCSNPDSVDSSFNSYSADQGTVAFSPSHYVENLKIKWNTLITVRIGSNNLTTFVGRREQHKLSSFPIWGVAYIIVHVTVFPIWKLA